MKKMKHLMAIAILLTISINGYGQVGIGTTTPAGALDVTSTNDGLLIPRVALTSVSSPDPLAAAPTISELVYNTTATGGLTPGYYYWDGAAWVRLATGTGSGVETDPKVGTLTANKIPRWNGTTLADGIVTDNGTTVAVAGKTSTTNFQMTNGAGSNLVLQSDTNGDARWVNANTLAITESDPQVGALTGNKIPKWNGAALVDGVVTDDGTNVGVGIPPSLGNKLEVAGKTKTTTFQMTSGAAENSVLRSDADGNATWVNANTTITENDPQVGNLTSNKIPKWSGTALVDGVVTDDGTNVGVGTLPATGNKLEVAGKTKTTTFQMTSGAVENSVLRSDAAGNATWVNANTTITENDPQVGLLTGGRVPRWNGTTLIDGAMSDNGTNVGIGIVAAQGVLDLVSTTNGLLIPRIALTNTTTDLFSPASNSELVYNTQAQNDVTPGFYYRQTATPPATGRWIRLITSNDFTSSTNAWSVSGNTVQADNFIGTTNAVDLAFKRNNAAAGKIGTTTTSFGVGALSANGTPGQDNTAFGVLALGGINDSASRANTAVGYRAFALGSSGGIVNSTAVGANAMESSIGIFCTAIGSGALKGGNGIPPSGQNNVAVGVEALRYNTSGANNTVVGSNAGNAITSGSNNIVIGSGAQASSATVSNEIILGNGFNTTLRCATNVISALSDRRDKTDILKLAEGIEFIKKLKPVTYTWNTRDKSKVGSKAAGFIAQDLLDLQKNSSIGDNLDLVTYSNPDRLEARYGNLLPVIVKGMQEQQELIEALQKSNAELLKANAAILERMEKLEKR